MKKIIGLSLSLILLNISYAQNESARPASNVMIEQVDQLVENENFNFAKANRQEGSASCPGPYILMGGGAQITHASPSPNNNALVAGRTHIVSSYPDGNTWRVVLWSDDLTPDYRYRFWASCARFTVEQEEKG